ncbi:MAG: helix-turn-helix transcriptional regulator [Pseudomonadales bacterium]|jgi:AraC-like DNA-binding protein
MAIDIVPTVLYSAQIGVVMLAIAQLLSKPKGTQTTFLIGLLGLLLIHIFGELYIYSGAYRFAPSIAGFQLPIRMMLGPALYFYAYIAMSERPEISVKQYLAALLGPLVIIIAMLPFVILISPEEKLALANPATRDPELWKIAVFTCLFSAVAFVGFTFIYLGTALRLHARHRRKLMEQYAEIEQRSMDWFKVILILWGLAWLMYAAKFASTFVGINLHIVGAVLPVVESLILLLFTHLAIRQTEVQPPAEKVRELQAERVSALSSDQMQQIANRLSTSMTSDKLFTDEELSLNRLAKHVEVSENYISETLSQCLNTNFYHFVNSYRVEAAKQMLISSDKLVSTIAYEVGFKSKSTFNSAFKKLAGTTPTAFKSET